MNNNRFIFHAILLITLCSLGIVPSYSQTFSGGIQMGYNGGPGFQMNGMVADMAQDFPFRLKMGLGYISSNPGSAPDARRVFINNATNGTPQKRAYRWDLRMDLSYPVRLFSLKRAYLFGGPRYTRFTANFNFIGGNEDFDVTCNQWAWGLGLENYFKMSSRLDLVTSAGFDYFMGKMLKGHDTSYSSDGTTVNGREDYTFSDADDAVNQPKFEFLLMLGINYYFN
jgi:hypothetical protein